VSCRNGDAGWLFDKLHVVTPRSEFTLDGRIDRRQTPTSLALNVSAPRFAFQEWSGVLRGLSNIAVESAFDARLAGPPAAMGTTITLRSNGGDVRGDLSSTQRCQDGMREALRAFSAWILPAG
jgi:hypothetical protein